MKKNTFYFSHDYNARSDPKLIKLSMKFGMEGIGIYWCVIEMLYENNGTMDYDLEMISYNLHSDINIVKSIIEEFDLFIVNNGKFYSKSCVERLELRNSKSVKASDSAKSRWLEEKKNKNEIYYDAGQVYVLHCFKGDESFIKVGVTENSVSRRYTSDKMPYDYYIIAQYFSDDYLKIERELNLLLANFEYSPLIKFGGYNECFSMDCIEVLSNYKPSNIIASQCDFITSLQRRNANKGKERKEKEKIEEEDLFLITPEKQKVDYEFIVGNFHELCPKMAKVSVISDARKKSMNARFGEHGIEKITLTFRKAGESNFLNGINDRAWKADFDWLMNPNNFIKVMEGKYQNKNASTDGQLYVINPETGFKTLKRAN